MVVRLSLGAALLMVVGGVSPAIAAADPAVPQLQATCPVELADTMTLLPDEETYAVCQVTGAGAVWAPVQTPFEPSDSWLSYGPNITLHGQGMRNPNLSSGTWTATPRDSQTSCRAVQRTVVAAGVLSAPEVSEGQPGEAMPLRLPTNLFAVELGGDCLWTRA